MQIGQGKPVVNEFEFDETLLESANLRGLHFDGYSKEWAEFVLMNRKISKKMLNEQAKMFMIEEIAKDIVCLLIEEKGMTMREALHTLYTSDTYARLTETENQLYTQSTYYVYEYLENELAMGRMA